MRPLRWTQLVRLVIPVLAMMGVSACATPSPTNVALPSTSTVASAPQSPTSPATTPTTAVIATTGDIRFFIVGYSPEYCGPRECEHIHLLNCDSKPINVTGWTIKSIATGDLFTFPDYIAAPGCEQTQAQFTVNTHVVGNEDSLAGIFTWNLPLSVEEWSPMGGKAELRDSVGNLVTTCTYAATQTLQDSRCRLSPATTQSAANTLTPTLTNTPTNTPTLTLTPMVALTSTNALTPTTAPTSTPKPQNTPTQVACVPAPTPFDPPDGKVFYAKSTILRWRSDYALKDGETFDVLVWPDGYNDQPSIGVTNDKTMSIDFATWQYNGILGKFYWTVRIKLATGAYLSCPSQPFAFTLTPPPPPPSPKSKPYGVAMENRSIFDNVLGIIFSLVGVIVVGTARLRTRRNKRNNHFDK